jgi:hypothetical protein
LHIRKVVEAMKRRLNSRTKGLLEISTHGHVEYIHRTAFDWINGIWDDIRSRIPEDFDAYLELLKAESCSIMIANKLLDSGKPKDNGLLSTESDWYWRHVLYCFSYAMMVKNTPASTTRLIRILEHLDSNMQTIINLSGKAAARGCSGNTAQHRIIWTSHQCPSPHDTTFVGLAAQFAVVPYLRAKITNKASLRSADTGKMSVLEGAVFGWECFPTEPFGELKCSNNFTDAHRLELIEFLLKVGADATQRCHTGKEISEEIKARYSKHDKYANAILLMLKKTRLLGIPSRLSRRDRKRMER